METIRDISALEELPEVAAIGLRRRPRNVQGSGNFNCQGNGATCSFTCAATAVGINVNTI